MKTNKRTIAAKRLLTGMLALAVFTLTSSLHAANPATISLRVTVAPALSIAVGTATYSFGYPGTNETALSTGAIPVLNDSFGRTEDFQITGANATNWSISNSTNGADQFYLRALLNTTAPAQAAFDAVFSTLSTTIANMSAANYGGNQNGNNVSYNGVRNLWFMLGTPTSTSFTTEQSISVTLTAADSSTF